MARNACKRSALPPVLRVLADRPVTIDSSPEPPRKRLAAHSKQGSAPQNHGDSEEDGIIRFHEDSSADSDTSEMSARGDGVLPFELDLSSSDLCLDAVSATTDEGGGSCTCTVSNAMREALPEAWVFARSCKPATVSGPTTWRCRVLCLDDDLQPSLMAGWVAHEPGNPALPTATASCTSLESIPQPLVLAATDCGNQVFSSNLSEALNAAPLWNADGYGMSTGTVLEVSIDMAGAQAWFSFTSEETRGVPERVESKRLPILRRGRANERLRYFPFFALRGRAAVQVYDESETLRESGSGRKRGQSSSSSTPAEIVATCGPPGAGKSVWAAQFAAHRGVSGRFVHVLGAEWARHRTTFGIDALRNLKNWRSAKSTRYPAQHLEDDCGLIEEHRWPLQRGRDAMNLLMPELLRRAWTRGVIAVADDCHLQQERRDALLEVAGPIRWVTVVPASGMEFTWRRSVREVWHQVALKPQQGLGRNRVGSHAHPHYGWCRLVMNVLEQRFHRARSMRTNSDVFIARLRRNARSLLFSKLGELGMVLRPRRAWKATLRLHSMCRLRRRPHHCYLMKQKIVHLFPPRAQFQ